MELNPWAEERPWVEVRQGVFAVQCYDCNRSLEIEIGKPCIVDVGEAGQVNGIMCEDCHSKLMASKKDQN